MSRYPLPPRKRGSRATRRILGHWIPAFAGMTKDQLTPVVALHQSRIDAGFRQLGAEAALVVFGDGRAFHLVAFVEEGHPETKGQIAEYAGVLGPGHHRTRRHDG